MSIEDIKKIYDQDVTEDIDKWDYEKCGGYMAGELKAMLHKCILVTRFRSATRH